MTGLTLAAVQAADPAAVATAAERWAGLAAVLDDALDRLASTGPDLETGWPDGAAARDAHHRLIATAGHAYEPCRRISRALRDHADALATLRHLLAEVVAEAHRRGLRVDLVSGGVHASAELLASRPGGPQLAQAVTNYVRELQEILDRAVDSDARTARTVAAAVPDPRHGAGAAADPPIGPEVLHARRNDPPAAVRRWWESLSRQRRRATILAHPDLVGRLDGIPVADRDRANRLALATLRATLLERLAGTPYPVVKADTAARLRSLARVERALRDLGPRGLLLDADIDAWDGDGRLVVSVGDPDTARHTAVWVPGLGTTVRRGLADDLARVARLQATADALTPHRPADVATVYWLGYDAPDLDNASVLGSVRAVAGRDAYLRFVAGLRAGDDDAPRHLTALGHSYGSTLVGAAAATGRLDVDDIVVAGSPGMLVGHAGDLLTDRRHVWAGAAADDPVPAAAAARRWTAPVLGPTGPLVEHLADRVHGPAPTTPAFGANRFVVDTRGHSGYWTQGSESLSNQARILAGRYDLVGLHAGGAPPAPA